MRPQLRYVGNGRHPLVTVDGLLGEVDRVIDVAADLAPFPPDQSSYYPGVRRIIGPSDTRANAYIDAVMDRAGQFIAGAFDAMRFTLLGASFSIVTRPSSQLLPMQRAPHFDSPDPNYVAMIHYLGVPSPSATAFFRQRSTGIERVDEGNIDRFVDTAKRESSALAVSDGYVQGSNNWFDELDRVEAVPDRLVFYQGGLLHSGIIAPDTPLDADPRRGRLTANLFLRLDREQTQ